jgi:hypothetical protein
MKKNNITVQMGAAKLTAKGTVTLNDLIQVALKKEK